MKKIAKSLLPLGVAVSLVFALLSCEEALPFLDGLPTLEDIQGVWSTTAKMVTQETGEVSKVGPPSYAGAEPALTVIQVIIEDDKYQLYTSVKTGDFYTLMYGIIGSLVIDTDNPEKIRLLFSVDEITDESRQVATPFWEEITEEFEYVFRQVDDGFELVSEGTGDTEVIFDDDATINWDTDIVIIPFEQQPETLDVEVKVFLAFGGGYPFNGTTDVLGVGMDIYPWTNDPMYQTAFMDEGTFDEVELVLTDVKPGNYMLGGGLSDDGGDTFTVAGGMYGNINMPGPDEVLNRLPNVPVFDGNTSFEFTIYEPAM